MNSKFVFAFLVIVLMSACSTMKPIEMTPEQLQQKISAGEVVSVGDAVKVATSNNEVYEFKVTAITDQQILGENIEIPINEVVGIETKEFSAGKTVAAVAGGTALLWAILVAITLGGALAV